MSIAVGDKLPNATLTVMGEDGPQQVDLADRLKGLTSLCASPNAGATAFRWCAVRWSCPRTWTGRRGRRALPRVSAAAGGLRLR